MSGGFAVVQPNSQLSINAVEGFPIEDFSADNVRAQIAEAQKVANGNGSEQEIAEAKIELEVVCLPPRRFAALCPVPITDASLCVAGPREPPGCPEIDDV